MSRTRTERLWACRCCNQEWSRGKKDVDPPHCAICDLDAVRRYTHKPMKTCKHSRAVTRKLRAEEAPRMPSGRKLRATKTIRELWNAVREVKTEPSFVKRANDFMEAVLMYVRELPLCVACKKHPTVPGHDYCDACLGRPREYPYVALNQWGNKYIYDDATGDYHVVITQLYETPIQLRLTHYRRVLISQLLACLDDSAGFDSRSGFKARSEKIHKMFPESQLTHRKIKHTPWAEKRARDILAIAKEELNESQRLTASL